MKGKTTEEIILIAGIDYPKFNDEPESRPKNKLGTNFWTIAPPNPLPFQKYCQQWALNSLKKNKNIKVTYFDIFNGNTINISLNNQGNLSYQINKPLLGKPNWNDYRYIQIDENDETKNLLVPLHSIKGPVEVKAPRVPQILFFPGISLISKDIMNPKIYFTEYFKFLAAKADPKLKNESKLEKYQCISITDIYHYIQEIGNNNLKSSNQIKIIEWHFFSHSFASSRPINDGKRSFGGPILINTYDNFFDVFNKTRKEYNLENIRNPLDMDCRAQYDFNVSDSVKQQLQAAVSDNCKIFIWGCNRDEFVKTLILATIDQPNNTKPFIFQDNKMWRSNDNLHDYYMQFLTKNGVPIKFTKETVIDLLLSDFIGPNYPQTITDFLRVKTIAPVLGTYSTNDETGNEKNKFMHVAVQPIGRLPDILDFYKENQLIKRVDVEHGHTFSKFPNIGRGYGIYGL